MKSKTIEYYFKVLGVTSKSSKQETKDAYRKLIKKWHPDNFPHESKQYYEATEKSKELNEAYSILVHYERLQSTGRKSDFATHSKIRPDGVNNNLNWTRVKSSNIHSVHYDNSGEILYIQFLDNSIYRYYNVPEPVFSALMKAESKGKFAIRYIFHTYRYKRV